MERRTFLEMISGAITFLGIPGSRSPVLLNDLLPRALQRNITSELRMHDGRQSLFIDGKPHDGVFCSVRSEYMKNFVDAGFDIFDARDVPHGWVGDGRYDFTETDEVIDSFLRQKPNALLILRCGWYPRNFWWVLKHQQEASVPHVRDKKQYMPSYASLRWREESSEALRQFVEHVENKYGGNVIAYLPDAGEPGEWFERYAFTEDEDRLTKGYEMGDYSEPMQRAYREYLNRKYGTIAELNRVYRQNATSFDDRTVKRTFSESTKPVGTRTQGSSSAA